MAMLLSQSHLLFLQIEQRTIQNCATVDLLATRRLDSGAIRVKDGNTLSYWGTRFY